MLIMVTRLAITPPSAFGVVAEVVTIVGAGVIRTGVDIGMLAATVEMAMAVEATAMGVAVTAIEGSSALANGRPRYYASVCGSH